DEGPAPSASRAVSPDDRLLALGLPDGQVLVFEAATGKEMRRFLGLAKAVKDVSFCPGSTFLIESATHEGPEEKAGSRATSTMVIWDVSTGRKLRVLEGLPVYD